MEKPSLPVAADTSYLLRLAEGDDDAWDALALLADRLRAHPRIATCTVMQELAHHASDGEHRRLARLAQSALRSLQSDWGFVPSESQFPLDHAAIEALARELVRRQILPEREHNDARILAEAAFSNAVLLVSEDSHLRNVDSFQLLLWLHAWKLRPPVILTARELARKFYR